MAKKKKVSKSGAKKPQTSTKKTRVGSKEAKKIVRKREKERVKEAKARKIKEDDFAGLGSDITSKGLGEVIKDAEFETEFTKRLAVRLDANKILRDIDLLVDFVKNIIKDRPDLEKAANRYMKENEEKVEKGKLAIETKMKEYKESILLNPSSTRDKYNVPYGYGTYDNIYAYTRAIYEIYKDEISKDSGLNNEQVSILIDDIVRKEPWILYKRIISSNDKYAGSTEYKSAEELIPIIKEKAVKYKKYKLYIYQEKKR